MEGEWQIVPSDKFCLNQVYDHDESTIYKLVSVYRAAATMGSIFDISKVNVIFIKFQDEVKNSADKIIDVPASTNEVSNLMYNIDSASIKKALDAAALGRYKVKINTTETQNIRAHSVVVASVNSIIRDNDKFIKDNCSTTYMEFAKSVKGPVKFMAVASVFSALRGKKR